MKLVVVLTALVLAACDSNDGPVFIALQSDFANFRAWPSTPLGDSPLPGHPAGERTAFLQTSLTAPAGAYPLGTLIVKTVAVDPTDETTWDLFGMSKRGGDFNSGGARNWEFFLFKIATPGGPPQIAAHGADPTDSPGARVGYMDSSGATIACNNCHGASGTDKTDYVLAPALYPGNFGMNVDGGLGDGP